MAGTIKLPSGVMKPTAPKGYTAVGKGSGRWVGVKAPKTAAPPTPDPLAPLSTQQIQQQASKTVNASYKPAYTDLNNQQKQATNLDKMRKSATNAYNQWMTSQISAIQSHNDTATQMLQNAVQANQAALNQSLGTNPIQAAQGSTLDPSQAGTDQGLVNDATAAAKATAANTGGSVLEAAARGTDLSGAVSENDFALTAANRQAQVAALDKTLQTLGDEHSKLLGQQGADTQKEVARLQGIEIQKAQANQNFAAAEQKLNLTAGVDAANIKHQKNEDINAANATKIAALNAKTAAGRAATAAGVAPSEITRNLAAANSSNANAAKAAATASGHKIATAQQTADVYNSISTVKDQIADIVANGRTAAGKPINATDAYHLIANGGTYYKLAPHTSTTKGQTSVNGLVPTSVSTHGIASTVADRNTILNAALNLYGSNSINTNDLAALNAAGVYGVRARYSVHAPKGKTKPAPNPLLPPGTGTVLAPGSTGLG